MNMIENVNQEIIRFFKYLIGILECILHLNASTRLC